MSDATPQRIQSTEKVADVAVIGLGVMGAAALWSLARRGVRAVGIERFAPGHDRGSSHGATRIIRQGYFEHPSYVPLVQAAYPLWRTLEQARGEKLLHVSGIIEAGRADSALVSGTLASSRLHGLPHETLDAAALMRRFPAMNVPEDFVGVFQRDGGFLRAEACVHALSAEAVRRGATIRTGEEVRAIAPSGDGVRVTTSAGTFETARVIVAAGPWMATLLPQLRPWLRPTRQVLGWFAPRDPALFSEDRFPVFLIENRDGVFYGFPEIDGAGVKVAKHHHHDETVDPERWERGISPADEAAIRSVLRDHLPAANGPMIAARTCLYTMTPDQDFILDALPGCPQIVVAAPCSGHGFKFAPVIGDILADLAISGDTAHDISRFRLDRFAPKQPT